MIRIDYSNSIECANRLSNAARTGEQVTNTFKSATSSMEASWKGLAMDGFREACQKWTVEMNSLIRLLYDTSSDIKSIANNYREKDERLRNSIV